MKTKKVNYTIEVPDGIYCHNMKQQIRCKYFDALFNICEMGMKPFYDKNTGVYLKPLDCWNLKNA